MSAPAQRPDVDAELLNTISALGVVERMVLLALAERLLGGQVQYGRLDLAHDARDWREERADELADALVYGAIAEVAATLKAAPLHRGEQPARDATAEQDARIMAALRADAAAHGELREGTAP